MQIKLKQISTKALFICPVLKTEWQIHHSIIGERLPNWSARKLLMCRSVIRMVNQPVLKLENEEGLISEAKMFVMRVSVSTTT